MANVECRKFAPNIFNKSKCSNCFRLKEDHSASAIELNKASRKISKCGYLFVAPDWDFSNPINRTKRWQRRWFVLYDDGELTYSVDDHPETIPQACIDMNKVMEVARADDVTGNLYSVAITAPDRVHFVKGTCKEESTWWLEVLQIFPRSSIKTGRAKRNATFPGGISTTYMAQYAADAAAKAKESSSIQTPPVKCSDKTVTVTSEKLSKSLVETETPVHDNSPIDDTPIVAKKETTRDAPKRELSDSGTSSSLKTEETQRYKKIKSKTSEGTRAYRSLRSNTCENLSAIPDYSTRKASREAREIREARLAKAELPPTPLFSASVSSSSIKYSDASPSPTPTPTKSQPQPEQPTIQIDSPQSEEEQTLASPSSSSSEASPAPGDLPVRGVPDGCGLDIALPTTPRSLDTVVTVTPAPVITSTPDTKTPSKAQIPIPSPHELLNLKKGWLMKQGPSQDWHKHWFVLQGTALMYFRDPASENNGLLDGIIDLGCVNKVEERDVARNYGFIVSTFDEREYVLSAVTHGIRNNWVAALKTAANLSHTPESDTPSSTKALTRRNTTDAFLATSTPLASDKPEPSVPISPPLTRTPTSRVKKDKTRARSSLKSSQSLSSFSLPSVDVDNSSRPEQDDNDMIPERDTNTFKVREDTDNVFRDVREHEGGSLDKSSCLLQLADVTKNDVVTPAAVQANTDTNSNNIQQATEQLVNKHLNEISVLKKRLENINGDMDTTLKNLNNEQVKNAENEKKIQDLEQSNSLLQIKCSNAEKSLREQSKEITSLNQKVREFSDLSSQYKTQIIENKTLRQKLDKMERMNTGPNWKTLYESLQEQHNTQHQLWENKLKDMENEMQHMMETTNEAEQKTHIITDLSHQLQDSEHRINHLLCRTDSLEKDNVAIKAAYDDEITRLKENIKELEEYIDRADSEKNSAENSEILRLRNELADKSNLELQLSEFQDKLAKAQDDNEKLQHQLLNASEKIVEDDKAKSLCCSRENISDKQLRLTKMDSLAELLTCVTENQADIEAMDHEEIINRHNDVVKRLAKAVSEIRSLKNTVKTSQDAADEMEITNLRLNQRFESAESEYSQQIKMLTTKIEDLTSKYLSSEKQSRLLKMKCNETKSRRRSSTGIRPDEFLINKEAEHVLDEIENNLLNIDGYVRGGSKEPALAKEPRKKSYEISTKASRARRKSSESSELSFVERLKKTDKTIADLTRKLSVSSDLTPSNFASGGNVSLENIRRQVNKCKADLGDKEVFNAEDVDKVLSAIDVMLAADTEVPVIAVAEEPGFPKCENISSHLDTVMTFLFKCVETSYEMRKECVPAESYASNIVSQYESGTALSSALDITKAIQSQETSLQAYLLLDLQQQVAKMETKFYAFGRDQTLKYYNDVTQTMLLKTLQSKNFVPLSNYSSNKIHQLSHLNLDLPNLKSMFRRLQNEARQEFSRIGSMTEEMVSVLACAILSDVSDKDSIVDNIKCEVLNLIEEDDRMREFTSNAINIFLIGADSDTGKDPERVHLLANHQEAQQSQAEVARILIDQEITDLITAIDVRIECNGEKDGTKAETDVERLSECIIKMASMLSQKCITESHITILNTILGHGDDEQRDKNSLNDDNNGEQAAVANFVFSPDEMNNECNEFMLVLNNYRQQSSLPPSRIQDKQKYSSASFGTNPGNLSLESNLRTLRQENESKKARLSAALEENKNISALDQDHKISDLRQWCEKSINAMEKSYENLLQDLQHQHLKEKDTLRKEKEQALAEETQATLAALDAMRKAHESEVHKEVEKFKKEFLADYQSQASIGALTSEYQTNRNELKREILSATDGWNDSDADLPPKLTRSPSCPRLYSQQLSLSLSLAAAKTQTESDQPLSSPLTGMVANRKRVFESDY